MRTVYTIALYLATPLFLARLLWRGLRNSAYRTRLGERFGLGARVDSRRGSIWVHAVSVGEVQAAVPIVELLRERYPEDTVVFTSTTPTGAAQVRRVFGAEVVHRYFPFDLPGAVARFLARANPRVAVVMETEIWPNLLAACRVRGVPVILANVRLSQRSAAGYLRFRRLFAPALDGIAAIAAQSRDDASRIESIGAPPGVIDVVGNTKFDVSIPAGIPEQGAALRRAWGVQRSVWIAASTHKGEEQQVLDAFKGVLERVPDSLLLLVPRHPERLREVDALARARGFVPIARSRQPRDCSEARVFIVDTMGELLQFYAAADVAFVGGTLVEVGGHNVLEPAALGVPVLLGPHVFNFAEISRRLLEAGGAESVTDSAELGRAVTRHLSDGDVRRGVGEEGRRFVESNRGAKDRVMAMIDAQLRTMGPR